MPASFWHFRCRFRRCRRCRRCRFRRRRRRRRRRRVVVVVVVVVRCLLLCTSTLCTKSTIFASPSIPPQIST